MAKKTNQKEKGFSLSGAVSWGVGILVSLAVGAGMIRNTLSIPFIPELITQIAGWIVVAGVIISIIATIFDKN